MTTPNPHLHPAFSWPPYPGPARQDLRALKERLLIPEVWAQLGLPGRPGRSCKSPFRQERRASFSIYDGGRKWWDHGTGQGGDVIDFIGAACGLDKADATRRFLALAGVESRGLTMPANHRARPSATRAPLTLPPLVQPTVAVLEAVARSRGLEWDAVSLAYSLGTVVFGSVHGQGCWILTDAARRVAEARRIDGLPFPELGTLGERKAHTLPGSFKAWPAGVAALRARPGCGVLLVEGGPDYLAALHLALACGRDALPVAMLGRGTGTRIDPAALAILQGRRVRVYPHADADGGGLTASAIWAAQLTAAGCAVDYLDFRPLRQPDAAPVKDLNDAVFIHPDLHANLLP